MVVTNGFQMHSRLRGQLSDRHGLFVHECFPLALIWFVAEIDGKNPLLWMQPGALIAVEQSCYCHPAIMP